MKPLFIPLYRQYFEAFAAGTKTEEWRRFGGRWTLKSCVIGRPAILCLGYSGARLQAVVSDVRLAFPETSEQVAFFGSTEAECIVLSLTGIRPA